MRVAKLYKRLGKKNVLMNQILVDESGNRSEIDVSYGRIFKRYIECKDYKDSVPLEMVAKFKAVLELNHIPLSHGIFITTSDYTPRAREMGIRLLNGRDLQALEKYAVRRSRFLLLLKLVIVAVTIVGVYAYYYMPLLFMEYTSPLLPYFGRDSFFQTKLKQLQGQIKIFG